MQKQFFTFPFSLFLFTLSFVSCDDESTAPESKKPECVPVSILQNDLLQEFEYDGERRLSKYIGPYDNYIKFEYENERLVTLIYYRENDESLVNDLVDIEYNGSGQWVRITHSYDDQIDEAEYDSKGNRIKIMNKEYGKIFRSYEFEYNQGNMIRQSVIHYNVDGSVAYTDHFSYVYDLKKENRLGELELISGHNLSGTNVWQAPSPSKNMINSRSRLDNDGGPAFATVDYIHEYNEQGFPMKSMMVGYDLNGNGVQDSGDTLVVEREYDCLF